MADERAGAVAGMAILFLALSFLICAAAAVVTPAGTVEPDLDQAHWIWSSHHEGVCFFRKEFTLPEKPDAAALLITADNGYELFVNSSFVGSDIGASPDVWRSVERYDIVPLLRKGDNVIGIRALHFGGASGLLVAARIELPTKPPLDLLTGADWKVTAQTDPTGFASLEFTEGPEWQSPRLLGLNGTGPWGKLPGTDGSPSRTAARPRQFTEAGEDYRWPDQILFLRGRVPETSTPAEQAVWRINNSRAYLELDVLGPSMAGRALYSLSPARPDAAPRLLWDAGQGLIGSPSVSFDGEIIYFSYLPAGEKFWRLYRMPARGGVPAAITGGSFHDFDPEPFPDGRIVFSSTRTGTREEYHGNAARSLYIMEADGSGIRPITFHIVGDMEPRVTASGNICFIRQDNFMQRAKVETHLHMIRPDGAAGHVLLGPDRGALALDRPHAAEEDGLWLRSFGFGSPAPLPDGRVATISSRGLTISGNSTVPEASLQPDMDLVDISPLPDGRLLCTVAGQNALGILDLADGGIVRLYSQTEGDLHSVTYLGARALAPGIREGSSPGTEEQPGATGFFIGRNVRFTKQIEAEANRIQAVRVLEGRPFALRSAKHQYAHLGVEAVELGTVPLAPDGSFYVEVPADRALAFQAIDAEGRSIINELSWIYVRPNEVRSCTGCHSPREQAPPSDGIILALLNSPVPLLGQGKPHRFRGNNAANGGVLNLQLDRMREIASIDLYAFPRDSGKKNDAAFPSFRAQDLRNLEALLAEGSLPEKISAAQRMALLRERTLSAPLTEALRDEHVAVRMNAALALAASGGKEVRDALLELLDDPAPIAAQAAHIALGAITAAEVPFNPFTRHRAGRAEQTAAWKQFFAAHHWNEIEEALIVRVRTGSDTRAASERVAPFAMSNSLEDIFNALGRIGGEPTKAALLEWLEKDSDSDLRLTLAAMRALGRLRAREAVPLLSGMLQSNLAKPMHPPAGHHEFGWTQRPVQIAAAAAEALGRIGGADAEIALIQSARHFVEFWHYTHHAADHDWLMGCHASPPHFRLIEALDTLESTQTASILPMLLKSVPIDPDRGLLFENDAYEILTARVAHRSGLAAEILEAAFIALECGEGNLPGPWHEAVTASPPAVTVLPFDSATRAAQLISILVNSPEHGPRLRNALDHYRGLPPSRSRNWICFYLARSLGKSGDAAAVEILISVLENDPVEGSFGRVDPPHVYLFEAISPYYRAAAAHALGELGDPRAAPALLNLLSNFENAMDARHAAAGALLKLKDLKTYPDLEELARDYPETATRRILLEARDAIALNQKKGRFALE